MRSTPRLRLRHFKADSGDSSHSAWVERPWPSIGTLYRTRVQTLVRQKIATHPLSSSLPSARSFK